MSGHLLHRGVVPAVGVWIAGDWLSMSARRSRALAAWEPGCRIFEVQGGLVVLWRRARPMACDAAHGALLTRRDTLVSASPLLAPAPGEDLTLCVPHAGRLEHHPLTPDREIQPTEWLNLDDWTRLETTGLGATPASLELVDVAPAGLQGAEGVRLVSYRSDGEHGQVARTGETRGAISALARWTRLGFANLWRAGRGGEDARAQATEAGLETPPQAPPSPWRNLLGRAAMSLGLSRLFGRRQAAYVDRVVEMFEDGDIEAALRHAIPIRGAAGGEELPEPAMGLPEPREELRVTARVGHSGRSMSVTGAFSKLEEHYRRAVRQLIHRGQIREAAFVLAELLDEGEAAVELLEDHDEHQLSAEIAEAKVLAPGLVVRQWFLAGDRERGVRVARRSGAFADAVMRLERDGRRGRRMARDLRQRWARTLAQAGSYSAAVDVVWPLEGLREQAGLWMEAAVALGGPAGARMLAKRLVLQPERFDDVYTQARTLLVARGRQAQWVRRALADGLLEVGNSPETQALARPTLRALVADAGQGAPTFTRVRRLLDLADDKAMRADLPGLRGAGQSSTQLKLPDHVITIPFARHDTGAVPVHDAAFLPSGHLVLALGEAGVVVRGGEGDELIAFDEPAHRLAVSDAGDRVIALARRGDHWRLARLTLAGPEAGAVAWAGRVLALTAWAPTFDGSMWFVGQDEALVAIDALAGDDLEAMWRVGQLGGPIRAIARNPEAVTCLVSEQASRELVTWGYELPALRLTVREAVPFAGDLGESPLLPLAVGAEGLSAALNRRHWGAGRGEQGAGGEALWLQVAGQTGTLFELVMPGDEQETLVPGAMNRDWLVLPRVQVDDRGRATETRIDVLGLVDAEVRLRVVLPGAWGGARLRGFQLTVYDNRGRVALIDLAQGDLVYDHRT